MAMAAYLTVTKFSLYFDSDSIDSTSLTESMSSMSDELEMLLVLRKGLCMAASSFFVGDCFIVILYNKLDAP